MKLIIGSDHAGKDLRKEVVQYVESKRYTIEDLGTFRDKANYAVEGIKVAENVSMGKADQGIIICGTGIGISIAANKVRKVRAALCNDVEFAKLAREHNDANILSMGARFITKEEAFAIVDTFLTTEFEGGRHLDRIDTISDYEESCLVC